MRWSGVDVDTAVWILGGKYTEWTQFGKKRDKIATLLEGAQDLVYSDDVNISCDVVRALKGRRQDSL
ncbi:hypothetical protein Tco_0822946 [Tanacetum coccineum]|uniref:Uncharacterized protein n=1 Tax=Tanacetum coccineum TaxID=301880 RepID=A0ABQ5AJI3_9ASTR